MSNDHVGRVVGLWRYPVKSMAAQALDAVDVSWDGLVGDRRWGFVRADTVRSGFPWLTIREQPAMWSYQPSFVDASQPDTSITMVRTPLGDELDVVDPALAAELGHGVRVIKQNRGIFDTMPLSVLTTQALATLGASLGMPLDALRFRPNVLIDAGDDGPFAEDAWVGAELTIGSLRMRVDQRDKRCVMVNVDPVSTERDPAVLRAIARERQACFGVYGSTVQPGRVAIGDDVTLVR